MISKEFNITFGNIEQRMIIKSNPTKLDHRIKSQIKKITSI